MEIPTRQRIQWLILRISGILSNAFAALNTWKLFVNPIYAKPGSSCFEECVCSPYTWMSVNEWKPPDHCIEVHAPVKPHLHCPRLGFTLFLLFIIVSIFGIGVIIAEVIQLMRHRGLFSPFSLLRIHYAWSTILGGFVAGIVVVYYMINVYGCGLFPEQLIHSYLMVFFQICWIALAFYPRVESWHQEVLSFVPSFRILRNFFMNPMAEQYQAINQQYFTVRPAPVIREQAIPMIQLPSTSQELSETRIIVSSEIHESVKPTEPETSTQVVIKDEESPLAEQQESVQMQSDMDEHHVLHSIPNIKESDTSLSQPEPTLESAPSSSNPLEPSCLHPEGDSMGPSTSQGDPKNSDRLECFIAFISKKPVKKPSFIERLRNYSKEIKKRPSDRTENQLPVNLEEESTPDEDCQKKNQSTG